MWGGMANLSGRVQEWIRRYLIAELAGLAVALVAATLAASWSPDRLAVVAYAGSLGETVGFYAGFLISQYRGADPAGPRRRRTAAVLALTVVEFGPAELADTLLVRPAAMFSRVAGHRQCARRSADREGGCRPGLLRTGNQQL
jgi:hypothetical protein